MASRRERHSWVQRARRIRRIGWNIVTLSPIARHGYLPRIRDLALARIASAATHNHLAMALGRYVQRHNRKTQIRHLDSEHTFFLRNPVQVTWLADLARGWPDHRTLRVTSVGCSTGAEIFSVTWAMHAAAPRLDVRATGVDISSSALDRARRGRFARNGPELKRLTAADVDGLVRDGLFEVVGDDAVGIPASRAREMRWLLASVLDPALRDVIGEQDVVIANNILCKYDDAEAARAMRNIATVLCAGGLLVVSGVDLDVKTRVAIELGLIPVVDRFEELYCGDPHALRRWPMTYWAPEPFDRRRRDWMYRYGTIFRVPGGGESPVV